MIDNALSFLWNAGSFIVVLGILVSFHEWGHFWVARRAGIKVLKFSIGFGKPIISWFGKDGVEYIIARFPLGGYVKMLDENEGDVAEEDVAQSFNRASVGKRIAVVSAGPIANLLLAVFFFWLTFMMGVTQLKPVLGEIAKDTPAAVAKLEKGMLIRAVGDADVASWSDVRLELASYLGEQGEIKLKIVRPGESFPRPYTLDIQKTIGSEVGEDPLTTLGLSVFLPESGNVVGGVETGKPADKAGIRAGDAIIQIDSKKIEKWTDLHSALINQAGKTVELKLLRNGQWIDLKVTLDAKEGDSSGLGYLGVSSLVDDEYLKQRESLLLTVRFGPLDSLSKAVDKTGKIFSLSIDVISKMLSGNVSVKNLSGPIGIAQGAGNSADAGLVYFLSFMAIISVSLGFLNLLPIPILDGGHLLFYLIELASGKPVPEKIQEVGMRIGILLILTLTVVALFNDLSRFG